MKVNTTSSFYTEARPQNYGKGLDCPLSGQALDHPIRLINELEKLQPALYEKLQQALRSNLMILASVLHLANRHILMVIGNYEKSKFSVKSENFDFKARNPVKNYGSKTVSITWITPLEPTMSVLITLALLTVTFDPLTSISRSFPFTVLAFIVFTSAARTLPGTTW